MKNLLLAAVVCTGLIVSGCSQKIETNQESEKSAAIAAETWLAIVDEGNYVESWDETALMFKNAVSKEEWEKSIQSARSNFGKVIKREIKSASYMTSLPGAPDGEYVVIQFKTEFEKKSNAIETITPMKEKDGSWRVSGYFIK